MERTLKELEELLADLESAQDAADDVDEQIKLELEISEIEDEIKKLKASTPETKYEPEEETIGTSDTNPDEDATLGIIEKMKGTKTMKIKADVGKQSLFIEWFNKYLNSIYSSFYQKDGRVKIKPGHEGGFVNLDSMEITLYDKLINDLWASSIPPLVVFYHEIGHVLYTTEALADYGKTITVPQVFNLLNWLEDFYIEDQLMKNLYFIKPYIKMLHEVIPDFIDDWEKPEFALHYYYSYEGLTPRWMSKKGIDAQFKNYIEKLKHLRASFASKFVREKFIRLFEEFYMFCVKNKIISDATPPPPLDPSPKTNAPNDGAGGLHTGHSSGDDFSIGEDDTTGGTSMVSGDAYATDEGEEVPESTIERPPYKPLDPKKGFDPMFKELMDMIEKEFDKSLFDSFQIGKQGKPEITQRTIPTTSPRSLIDPVAIETGRSDIYLEYTTEEFTYTAYNLFIDVSGSVGYNTTFNTLARDIIKIISYYPYNVYGYGNDVTKWDQNKIDDVMNLYCSDGTESQLIGDIILEKKELGNLNIVLSDGDLSNLCRRKDIAEITKQYLFVFVVATDDWRGWAEKYFEPNQYYTLKSIKDLPDGLKALQKYIKSKGL